MHAPLENSLAWYASVARAHGIPSERTEHAWSTSAAMPPYYSNLVTRTRDGARAQLDRIRALAAAPPRPVWSLKDSFAHLDPAALEDLGLRVLFDARWYVLDAGRLHEPTRETDVTFAAVATTDGLAEWERAWQASSPAPGRRVFPPAVLDDGDVTFHAARRDGAIVGGAVTNLSPRAVGLSNVFTLHDEPAAPFLRDCARRIRGLHRDRAVVGYGRGSALHAIAALGFRDEGPLRVWIRELVD